MARRARTAGTLTARLVLFAGSVLSLSAIVSCGASIQALYEGDVRFEHCMALDARTDIEVSLRKTCWQEWATFYTYGQTRDRIEYARQRQSQLASGRDSDDAEWLQQKPRAPSAVPDPTSVTAPPPMMLTTDAGAPEAGAEDAGADASEEPLPPAAACAAECGQSFRFCQQECRTAPCEKTCAAKYKRCMRRCY